MLRQERKGYSRNRDGDGKGHWFLLLESNDVGKHFLQHLHLLLDHATADLGLSWRHQTHQDDQQSEEDQVACPAAAELSGAVHDARDGGADDASQAINYRLRKARVDQATTTGHTSGRRVGEKGREEGSGCQKGRIT